MLISMITRLPVAEMTQYAAPLTGLAGLALRYWFGTERPPPSGARTEPPAIQLPRARSIPAEIARRPGG